MSSLETELYGLAWLDAGVPAQVGSGVGVAAGDGGVPGAAQGGAIGVLPADSPAVDRTAALVGDADGTGETCTPVIADHIAAIAAGSCSAGGYTAARTAGCRD